MMQVIRVCDADGGCRVGVGGRSCTVRVCVNVHLCLSAQDVISFSECRVRGYTPLKVTVAGVMGGLGDMHGSTVPEASKLPVIFPMMQRSVHNHGESILLRRSQRAGPAHRLTGCHNNPDPAPRLLEQNSGKPTATATPLVTTPSRRSLWIPGKHSVLGVNIGMTKGGGIRPRQKSLS